jgi:hypothetical protein
MHRYISATVALVVILSVAYGPHRRPASAAPADIGYRDFQFGSNCNSTPTGEKPESKLWWNDGFWWGSLCAPDSSYHIYRLDASTQTWLDTSTPLDNRPDSAADTLWDGQKLYVASHIFTTSGSPTSNASQWGRLYRYSYNPVTKTYSLDSGFPVDVTRGRSETLVLEKAPSGQLWVTYVEDNNVMVNHSIGDDSVWATPFVLPADGASNLDSDDISSIITFDRATAIPQVGILWSNQKAKKMYFAVHMDGAATTLWNSFGVFVSSSGNTSAADDHINIKLQSDGTGIYAVTKTSNSSAGQPAIVLLSCRSMCSSASSWQATPVYSYGEGHTRAILLLDTTNRKVNVFSTTPQSGGRIIRAVFDTDTLSPTSVPESKTVFIENAPDTQLNNSTSTKQTLNSATGLVVLASDEGTRFYLHNYDTLAGAVPISPTNTPTNTSTATPTSTPTNTPTATPSSLIMKQTFLPFVGYAGLPDLVGSFSLIPNKSTFEAGEPIQISVTIANMGDASSTPAWADLYINPSIPPVAPGTPWNVVCVLQPCFGLVWIVPTLAPGQSVTLTSAAGDYAQSYSRWPGWFAQGTTELYLYVDSWNPGVPAGAVIERNEGNNRSERLGIHVTGPNPPLVQQQSVHQLERWLP